MRFKKAFLLCITISLSVQSLFTMDNESADKAKGKKEHSRSARISLNPFDKATNGNGMSGQSFQNRVNKDAIKKQIEPMVQMILFQYKAPAVDKDVAEALVTAAIYKHDQLREIFIQFTKPSLFKGLEQTDAKLIFIGPPSTGKTMTAFALAQYYNLPCIYLKGSEIGNEYKDSGPSFLKRIFKPLLMLPDQNFVVVIDEIMLLAERFNNDKHPDKKTATALWQHLDEALFTKNILVIGTDNDIAGMPAPLRSRFEGAIFTFDQLAGRFLKELITKKLTPHACSNKFISSLPKRLKDFSSREIISLINKAKRHRILKVQEEKKSMQDKDILVTDNDVLYAMKFFDHPTGIKWLWSKRSDAWNRLKSITPQLIAWGLTGYGLYLQYKSLVQQKEHHKQAIACALAGLAFNKISQNFSRKSHEQIMVHNNKVSDFQQQSHHENMTHARDVQAFNKELAQKNLKLHFADARVQRKDHYFNSLFSTIPIGENDAADEVHTRICSGLKNHFIQDLEYLKTIEDEIVKP